MHIKGIVLATVIGLVTPAITEIVEHTQALAIVIGLGPESSDTEPSIPTTQPDLPVPTTQPDPSAPDSGSSTPRSSDLNQDLIGIWLNTDPNTRGITHLIIQANSNNHLTIQVFGKCHPTDCDWGSVNLVTHGKDVTDRNHRLALAQYHHGFADTLLTLNMTESGELALQGFTQFLDNSGRQNYSASESFKRN